MCNTLLIKLLHDVVFLGSKGLAIDMKYNISFVCYCFNNQFSYFLWHVLEKKEKKIDVKMYGLLKR